MTTRGGGAGVGTAVARELPDGRRLVVHVTVAGGGTTIPGAPGEPAAGYPEVDMFGPLPAWGYYFRHVRGLTFGNSTLAGLGSAPPWWWHALTARGPVRR